MNENKIAKALQWVVNQIPDFKPKTNDEKFILAVKLQCDAGVKEIKRLEAELQKLKQNTRKATDKMIEYAKIIESYTNKPLPNFNNFDET